MLRVCLLVSISMAGFVVPALAELPRLQFRGPDGDVANPRKIRLAGATRDAVALASSQRLIAELPASPGVLVLSFGAPAAAPARAVLEIDSGEGWQFLDEVKLGAGEAGWLDHRIELAAAAESRRLAVRRTGAGAGDAWIGSPRYQVRSTASPEPPNVIVMSLDTLGAEYLGWFGGHASASTHIDAFLSRAFSFRRAYATYPNTLVSHASLFSGMYPSTHGVYGSLRDSQVETDLLSTILQRRGYFNVAFTENAYVSSNFGFDRDFDWYDDGPERGEASFLGDARYTLGRAAEWLETYGEDGPFLLFVHTYEVHSPYVARDAESERMADSIFSGGSDVDQGGDQAGDVEHLHNAGFRPLSPDQVRRLEALHVGEIHYLDRVFGDFLDRFERLDVARRTLFIVVADHGDEFDPYGKLGHGETLDDIVLHVPLAFYWPARLPTGVYEGPVSLVDVAPTVLDLLGLAGELPGCDGRSLTPLFRGEVSGFADRAVFAELLRAAGSCRQLGLPEDCIVGRFVAWAEDRRFESSMIPSYEVLEIGGRVESEEQAAVELRALLASYVTGAPWQSRAPWRPRPQSTDAKGGARIDEATRQRLKALGYDF